MQPLDFKPSLNTSMQLRAGMHDQKTGIWSLVDLF